MKVQTREKAFKCQFCQKELESSSDLKAHIRVHANEGFYVCEECGKRCNTFKELKQHLKSKHNLDHPKWMEDEKNI